MTDLSKLSETELLAIWNKDNFGLKGQLYTLEQEYIEAKEILDNWQNKDHPLYERHQSCVDGSLPCRQLRKSSVCFNSP